MAQKDTKKSDYVNMMTPLAPMMYINLAKADEKYGKFGVTIVLDRANDEHKAFIDKLEVMNQEAFDELLPTVTKERKKYTPKSLTEQEDEAGEETGKVLLKAITLKQVPVFDAALPKPNKLETSDLNGLWSGTEARCKLSLKKSIVSSRYTIGYTVYLSAVQLVTPIYGGDNDGFEGIDGGFSTSSGAPGAVDSDDELDGANF